MSPANNQPKTTILKDARIAKGLSLDLVHEATKIPLDALKSIEEGYSVKMLTPFYFKGFVKIYAEFLGLDYKEVYVAYGIDKPVFKDTLPTTAAPTTPKPKATPIAKPTVKSTVKPIPKPITPKVNKPSQPNPVVESLKALLTPQNISLLLRLLVFFIILVVIFRMGGCMINSVKNWSKNKPKKTQTKVIKKEPVKEVKTDVKKENKVESKKSETAVKKETVEKKEKPDVKPEDEGINMEDKKIGAQTKEKTIELAIRASRDTWLQVKADDKIVFQMSMKKGEMESWSADKQIELSGKNINELDMEVNGKHIGALGSSERRAKRVIITKEGLTVKK